MAYRATDKPVFYTKRQPLRVEAQHAGSLVLQERAGERFEG